jgi:hypothetical protein
VQLNNRDKADAAPHRLFEDARFEVSSIVIESGFGFATVENGLIADMHVSVILLLSVQSLFAGIADTNSFRTWECKASFRMS